MVEFLASGRPVSVQAGGSSGRLKDWKAAVTAKAKETCGKNGDPYRGKVSIVITHIHSGAAADLDNTLKPILDALVGVSYTDDEQIVHLEADRFSLSELRRGEVDPAVASRVPSPESDCVHVCVRPVEGLRGLSWRSR